MYFVTCIWQGPAETWEGFSYLHNDRFVVESEIQAELTGREKRVEGCLSQSYCHKSNLPSSVSIFSESGEDV